MKLLFFTDQHITDTNSELVINTCRYAVQLARQNSVDVIISGGDWLESRRQGSISTIETLRECFDILANSGVKFYSISGNHDKSDQTIPKSFVSAIIGSNKHHIEVPTRVLDAIDLYPYFPEHQYPATDFVDTHDKIAICHASFVGARNLSHESRHGLDANEFSEKYMLTLVGHFHNRHRLKQNVIYTGSIAQTKFGEDEFKGYSIVEWDKEGGWDIEYHKNPYTPVFVTHKINVDVGDDIDFKSLVSDKTKNHRIELVGSRASIESLTLPPDLGAKIIKRICDDEITDQDVEIDFSQESVFSLFPEFCAEADIATNSSLYILGEKFLRP